MADDGRLATDDCLGMRKCVCEYDPLAGSVGWLSCFFSGNGRLALDNGWMGPVRGFLTHADALGGN